MATVPGYRIVETLHAGRPSVVHRAVRESDGLPVILKTLTAERSTPGDLARYRYAQEITRTLDHPGVARILAIVEVERVPIQVSPDTGSEAIRVEGAGRGLSLDEVLDIGVQVASALGHCHEHDVVHKDIKPSNLVRHPTTGRVSIIDFDLASRLSREEPEVRSPNQLLGTLQYMSPEQTGRMNRPIDYRTDLYSLGVSLYELASGTLPFDEKDPMAMVHAHLAEKPEPLHERAPKVPIGFSRLVSKLLEKAPEDRYQSAYGLQHDLERCREALAETGTIAAFPLGARDVAARFRVPEKLYGREVEQAALLGAFRRAAAGRAELCLVSGYSGVGKSSLVAEIHKPMIAERGRFVSGKFDQLRSVPYAAIAHAFHELAQDLLTEPEDVVAEWRERLRDAVGSLGRILVDLVPELGLVLGDLPPVMPLPPAESQNRLRLVFQRFVRACAREDHPLALFLDDLQWADAASLRLLHLLLADPETKHLFVLGAYRDNEVGDAHPLSLALEDLAKAGAVRTDVHLAPLDLASTTLLVAETVGASEAEARDLAALVHQKTGGNPFFVEQFLRDVYRSGHLAFDAGRGRWRWDLAAIRERGITDNVADLMAREIGALPAETRDLLRLAACVGNTFDLGTLAIVAARPATEVARALWPAVTEELCVPVAGDYRYVGLFDDDEGGTARTTAVTYRFLHDRVQEAAYAGLDAGERKEVHLGIGRHLLGSPEGGDERLFDVVHHLDLGRELITDPGERKALARLLLTAGQRAMASAAYAPARRYLRAGTSLLDAGAWDRDAALAFALHRYLGEAAQMCGEFDEARTAFDLVLEHAATPAAEVEVRALRITLRNRANDYAGAIGEGFLGLARYGVVDHGDDMAAWGAAIGEEMGALAALLETADIAALADAPDMVDPDSKLQMSLILSMTAPAYTQPHKFTWLIMRMVRLSLEKGKTFESILAYGFYGLLLSAMGEQKKGERFARVALDMSEKLGVAAILGPNEFLFGAFTGPWTTPFAETRRHLARGFALLLEAGNFDYAGWAGMQTPWHSLMSGEPLPTVLEEARKHVEVFRTSHRYDDMVHFILAMEHAALSLMGRQGDKAALEAGGLGEAALLEKLAHYGMARACLHVHRMQASYVLGDYPAALSDAAAGGALLAALGGHVATVEHVFWHAMTLAAVLGESDEATRTERDATLRAHLAQLAAWAAAGPSNHAWKHRLVEAEVAAIDGKSGEARRLYDEAIDLAAEHGFTHGEAVASERAAAFHDSHGNHRIGRHYLSEARASYARWGATAKVTALDTRHPGLRIRGFGASLKGTASSDSGTLDVLSILKASQALSSVIVLDDLLERLMGTLLENAGAERGTLFIRSGDELRVEAHVEASGQKPVVRQSLRLEDAKGFAKTVVRFVERTADAVVLGDATRSPRFGSDPHIAERAPRSILCTPILNQGNLVGVLYLENNLATEAFNEDRRAVLDMLSAQAAISLENALLYDARERMTRSLARFVPEEFLALLGRTSIVDVALGDAASRDMAVLFTDIRDFTSISEAMTPKEIFDYLNAWLAVVGPILARHGGIIDKYIGDAVMALFPGSSDDALAAAVEMQKAVGAHNAGLRAKGKPELRIGIGLHRGELVLGTIGYAERVDGTVISDAVNTASRLEGVSKVFGTRIAVSADVFDSLSDQTRFAHRRLGQVVLKGKERPLGIVDVFAADPEPEAHAKAATRTDFEAGIDAFLGGDVASARARFEAVLAAWNPGDGDVAARYYLEELGRGGRGGTVVMKKK